jgi:hypothetical protein
MLINKKETVITDDRRYLGRYQTASATMSDQSCIEKSENQVMWVKASPLRIFVLCISFTMAHNFKVYNFLYESRMQQTSLDVIVNAA